MTPKHSLNDLPRRDKWGMQGGALTTVNKVPGILILRVLYC